ncbi:MAG: VOC family protein [Acidobacteria bacterium]|nr:VOC family protein [Acidobacteriota bacterium]
MKPAIGKLFQDFNEGKMNRRQLLQALGLTAGGALAVGVVPGALLGQTRAAGAGRSFPPTTMNHLALAITDYARSRNWYVDLFGMDVRWDDGKGAEVVFGPPAEPNGLYIRPVGQNAQPGVGHMAFGVPTPYLLENKNAMKAEMERRGLKNIRPDGDHGWIADDPAGYMQNTWVPIRDNAMFPGAARPCAVANSQECKDAFEAGLKEHLKAAPKPSGRGFKALHFRNIVLSVPQADLAKEKEFYSGMYAMKVLSDDQNGVLLQFGKNTMALRRTANPTDKPYCRQFGFAIEGFDAAKVKAELDRRGLNPQPVRPSGWMVKDPDGMTIEIVPL